MRIGFDFNGVIVNNAYTKSEVAKKYFGINLRQESTSRKKLNNIISIDKFEKIKDIVYSTSEMLSAPPHSEYSRYYLKSIMRRHEVFIVSRIQPRGVQFGKQWLRERSLDANRLVSVGPGGDKSIILQHGFDAYIDDDPEQLKSLETIVPHLFLMDTPTNRHYSSWNITRIRDWQELRERIEYLNAEKSALPDHP